MRKSTEIVLTVKEIHEQHQNIPESKITLAIRKNELKAVKRGRAFFISQKDLNVWLGIESNSEEEYRKDLYIQELENKCKGLEMRLGTFKSLLTTMNQVADIQH